MHENARAARRPARELQSASSLRSRQSSRKDESSAKVEKTVGAATDDRIAARLVGVRLGVVALEEKEEDDADHEEEGGAGEDGDEDLLLEFERRGDEVVDVGGGNLGGAVGLGAIDGEGGEEVVCHNVDDRAAGRGLAADGGAIVTADSWERVSRGRMGEMWDRGNLTEVSDTDFDGGGDISRGLEGDDVDIRDSRRR